MAEREIHCARARLANGWQEQVNLHLDPAGTIIDMTQGPPGSGAERLDGPVVPGMPNLHSHGFQYLIAGLTAARTGGRDDFWSWRQAMYGLATRMEPQQYEDCLAWVYLQMLRSGFTQCAEFHYLHHQPDGKPYADPAEMSARVLAAADRAGMPVTLLPVLYMQRGFGDERLEPHQRRFGHDLESYLDLINRCSERLSQAPNCRVGAAPHSLRAVPADILGALSAQLPREMRKHIHVAEQAAEVRDSLECLGARPVEWLLDHVGLDTSWCLVHATHMTTQERRRAAASEAIAGLCPITEADLGDGFFEAEDWLSEGGRFGIGSDSNVRISLTGELRQLEYSERLRKGRRNVLANEGLSCGAFLYLHAAESGAIANGQPAGKLATGLRADLVELDPAHPLLLGRSGDMALDSWVFSGGHDMVRSVWVAGRRCVEHNHHVREEEIERAFRGSLAQLVSE